MGEFVIGDSLRYLPCVHTYHKDCIDDWLMRSFTCPSCMEPVDSALLMSYETNWSDSVSNLTQILTLPKVVPNEQVKFYRCTHCCCFSWVTRKHLINEVWFVQRTSTHLLSLPPVKGFFPIHFSSAYRLIQTSLLLKICFFLMIQLPTTNTVIWILCSAIWKPFYIGK